MWHRRGRSGHEPVVWAPMVLALACGTANEAEPPVRDVELRDGQVARVGAAAIAADAVAAAALAQGLSTAESLDRIVRDRVFAAAARATPGWTHRVADAERATLARVLLERVRAEAAARPLTDDEVRRGAAERWMEYDRPVAARTIHAVVQFKDEADEPRARTVAESIRQRVEPLTAEQDFERAVSTVATEGLKVKVERLEPVTADGRIVAGDGSARLVAPFARAANEIPVEGATSPVIRTEFGYHVIRLLERLPAKTVPLAEARRRLEPDLMLAREQQAHIALVRTLAARERPAIERSAVETMGIIDVEP